MDRIVIIAAALLVLTPGVTAHLAGGEHVEKDGVIVDLGYTPEDIHANEPTTLLVTAATNQTQVKADQAWIRIQQNNQTLLSTTVKPTEAGSAQLTYTFPDDGEAEITTGIGVNDSTLVEHTFTTTIHQPSFLDQVQALLGLT